MKIIVPCCGRSSRYPGQQPKWMLPGHDQRPMISLALEGLSFQPRDLVVTILREHEEQYGVIRGLRAALGAEIELVVLDEPTKSQAETVANTLRALRSTEPFLVKDSDNRFALTELEQPSNYVCVESLNNFDLINPRNKSYVAIDHNETIEAMAEKRVISDLFSVGGYFFREPDAFLHYYETLSAQGTSHAGELYLSNIIAAMLEDGAPFRARSVSQYQDWGTVVEWRRSLLQRATFFVLLDGFVFERGSEYFSPSFEEAKPNLEAVRSLQELSRRGSAFTYLSIRPERFRDMTLASMDALELPKGEVLFDCPSTPWVMFTAPHPTMPFRTGSALELDPKDPNVAEKLLGEIA